MISVTAAILFNQNKLLIAQRKSQDMLAELWELPGGKVEKNETLEDCLIREIKEEFSIDIEILSYFGESKYTYPKYKIRLLAYKVKWISGVINLIEHKDYKWVSADEIDKFNFAPADIPLIEKIKEELK